MELRQRVARLEREANDRGVSEAEQDFRLMADTAPVMLWMSGGDALCTFFNRRWLEYRGRTLEEEAGNGWLEGVHAEDRQGCMDTYLASFEARREFRLEYRLRRHDGEYCWIVDAGVPRLRAGRNVRGLHRFLHRDHGHTASARRAGDGGAADEPGDRGADAGGGRQIDEGSGGDPGHQL